MIFPRWLSSDLAAVTTSRFQISRSYLFEDYVNTFPFWLSEMEVDIRRDPQQAFIEERERKRKEAEDAQKKQAEADEDSEEEMDDLEDMDARY